MRHSAKAAARLEKERQAAARSRSQPGGAAPGSWLDQLPYGLVIAGIVAGLLWMRSTAPHARSGTLVVAGVFLGAAVMRLVLPERRAGLLGSRRRLVDVAALAALGTALLVAGLILRTPA
jgi:Protein of unknown function (DUF3017)